MPKKKNPLKVTRLLALLGCLFLVIAVLFGLHLKINGSNQIQTESNVSELAEPFPVSVDSHNKTISSNIEAELLLTRTLADKPAPENNLWSKIVAVFNSEKWYQNLASPVSRVIVILPGERREEIVNNIAGVLRWDSAEKKEFEELINNSLPVMSDGKYFPGQYVIHRNATPSEVKTLIEEAFNNEVLARYTKDVASKVPLEDTLVIASLIEREASDFENMREVSGVIWNRLFTNMPLQLDATLQYAKGDIANGKNWWPTVKSADKFIVSPFNTYQNSGLPPSPIANPSTESILAALNPVKTDCLYYFHTDEGEYHCSTNYKDHTAKLRSLYGRGS